MGTKKTLDKAIKMLDEARYKIEKGNIKTDTWSDLGTYNESDMKSIIRGYKFNGLFYEKKNSNTIYTVTKVSN